MVCWYNECEISVSGFGARADERVYIIVLSGRMLMETCYLRNIISVFLKGLLCVDDIMWMMRLQEK